MLWVSENNHFFQKNLSTYLGENGINPKRLIFATRINCIHEHLTRMSFADIFLDTFPFNAHTTALDAIKAELPIVSLLGKSFSSRVSASILNSINMPELISESVEKYIATAVDLAKSQKFLHDTKTKLRENSKKYHLFDTSWYAKNLEFAFLEAIRRYDHHLPIEDIRIS